MSCRRLRDLLYRHLARALSQAERDVLVQRIERLGEDRLGEVVLALSSEALAAWLADPNAA